MKLFSSPVKESQFRKRKINLLMKYYDFKKNEHVLLEIVEELKELAGYMWIDSFVEINVILESLKRSMAIIESEFYENEASNVSFLEDEIKHVIDNNHVNTVIKTKEKEYLIQDEGGPIFKVLKEYYDDKGKYPSIIIAGKIRFRDLKWNVS